MKFRRFAAAALATAMCLATPALAAVPASEGSADALLTQVTQKVKAVLSVPDSYTQFYGQPQENYLGTFWDLNWSGKDGDLNVTATSQGKILSMNLNTNSAASMGGRFDPHFPELNRAQAQEKAQAFLDRVLAPGETAVFSDSGNMMSLPSETRSFWGKILLNGLSSPLTFYVRVRLADGVVTGFNREDVSQYVGELPGAVSKISQKDAAAKLKGVLALRLEYVLDGEKAVLRYLPEERDDYYVDAATGELVNLTQLREKLNELGNAGGSNNAMADSAAPAPEASAAPSEKDQLKVELTEKELEGIAKLEDLLTTEELDQKARAWKQLGLDGFERAGASFTVDKKEDTVNVRLTYAKKAGDEISRRFVMLDAKTGELLEVYGYDPYDQDAMPKLDQKSAQAKAEAFLKALWPDQFSKTEQYSSDTAEKGNTSYSFQFAQKQNGYFFPGNSINVRVNGIDGTILGVSRSFDEKVVFDSADGLISEADALTAWAGGYPMQLSYIAVPVRLDLLGKEVQPLINAGLTYYNTLKPGYDLSWGENGYSGVDAKTGKLVEWETHAPDTITYADLKGHWAEAAFTELAEYRVGWQGGKASPDSPLTQVDLVALLASADGYRYDVSASDETQVDELYRYAYYQGILTREERADTKQLTRLEMVKMLLNSLGYRTVAGLPGIYRCDFTDAGQIPDAALGYAALAQGLGIVSADSAGRFVPNRTATRAEAAVMLWKYMHR